MPRKRIKKLTLVEPHDGPWIVKRQVNGSWTDTAVFWFGGNPKREYGWASSDFAWLAVGSAWQVHPVGGVLSQPANFNSGIVTPVVAEHKNVPSSGACRPFGSAYGDTSQVPVPGTNQVAGYHAVGTYRIVAHVPGGTRVGQLVVTRDVGAGTYTETFAWESDFRWPHATDGVWWEVAWNTSPGSHTFCKDAQGNDRVYAVTVSRP